MFPVCYSGTAGNLDRLLAPIRKLGTSLMDQVVPTDYVAVQKSGDITDPRAEGAYLKSGFVSRMPPALIDALVDRFEGHPARSTAVFFQQGVFFFKQKTAYEMEL